MRKTSFILATVVSAASLALAGCDVDKTQEGNIDVPKYEVTKTDEGSVTLPKYDVDAPSVDVGTTEKQVTLPDVDINTKKETVTLPTIDIKPAAENDEKVADKK